MSQEFVIELARTTLYYTAIISAPILVVGLIIGLVVSVFQTVTQIREMTLTFIPKIVAVMLMLIFSIPWMINKFVEYMHYIMNIISTLR
jgi:flagellar biosynthetic protein FliQ